MLDEAAIDAFLSHHGVKGQKWGIRNDRGSNAGGASQQSKGQKFLEGYRKGSIIVSKIAAGVAVSIGAGVVARQLSSKVFSQKTSAVIGLGASIFGGAVTDHLLRNFGNKKVNTVKKEVTDADIYSAQRSLGLKTIPDPNGEFEKHHQSVLREIKSHGGKAGGALRDFSNWNLKRYNNKVSKRKTAPPSQRAALAIRRALGKPTPTTEKYNKQFQENSKLYRKLYLNS